MIDGHKLQCGKIGLVSGTLVVCGQTELHRKTTYANENNDMS